MNDKKQDGGHAFPLEYSTFDNRWDGGTIRKYHRQQGMSLRDYFAAKALQGMCANPNQHTWAKGAYKIADEMLKVRDE